MEIILLAGQAGVGKTTAAKTIASEAFNKGFIPVLESFAGPIKQEAADKGYTKEDFPEKYRKYCQTRGAMARQESPDYWVDLMKERISKLCIEEREDFNKEKKYWEKVVIVDDCRYLNEINLGIMSKASLVFLSYGEREFDKGGSWRVHESESMANSVADGDKDLNELFDHILENDGSQKSFEAAIKALVPDLLGFKLDTEEECTCPGCLYDTKLGIEELLELLDFENIEREYDDEEEHDEET